MREQFWGGLVLGMLLGAGLVWAAPKLVEQWRHWRGAEVELRPTVAVQASTLRLRNQDSFGWTNVRLVLNAHESGAGYTFRLDHLPAEASVDLALASFTTSEGRPFDPRASKAFGLSPEAKTPQGWGAWSGRLDEDHPR